MTSCLWQAIVRNVKKWRTVTTASMKEAIRCHNQNDSKMRARFVGTITTSLVKEVGKFDIGTNKNSSNNPKLCRGRLMPDLHQRETLHEESLVEFKVKSVENDHALCFAEAALSSSSSSCSQV
mmetsp:Transcript_154740/g.269432  ORF Transcript_154740/g.269432 Transcript_154740/m.269432 type:complete len:123 (+) Transcript_154740:88-456(+)